MFITRILVSSIRGLWNLFKDGLIPKRDNKQLQFATLLRYDSFIKLLRRKEELDILGKRSNFCHDNIVTYIARWDNRQTVIDID